MDRITLIVTLARALTLTIGDKYGLDILSCIVDWTKPNPGLEDPDQRGAYANNPMHSKGATRHPQT